jgi:hypothetical protein
MKTQLLFFIKIYLLSTLLCVVAVAAFGDLPSVIWAVFFPMVTLLAVLIADWLDKNVTISVHVGK